ncbi:MAG: group II intron reverse transcriptase/maturase [Deltaproteobacteria bacterium]|nr:group II intron reverse transcriptase/maturase [Deltaproteobacteria bacterium]
MRKPTISLQELRRRIYRKAKADKEHCFWGLYVHVAKLETLEEAYQVAKENGGAPGIDGVRFEDIETSGRQQFLEEIRQALLSGTYEPQAYRTVEIPKGEGKVRKLSIPTIRDRVVQGAVKLILEAVFEADFCPNSHGYRPKRSPHRALAEVRRSLLRRMSTGVEVDLSDFFDGIRHHILLQKVARRVQDDQLLALVKKILKAGGKKGVPQGGPFSPLAANIYLNELDWEFERIRQKTVDGPYDSLNYHRFSDDILVLVSGHHSKGWMVARVQERLRQHLVSLEVKLNEDKTKVVNTLQGEAFAFLGFDLRRARNRREQPYILLTPRKKARLKIKAKIREIVRRGGHKPLSEIIQELNAAVRGWVQYFRVANSNRAFGEVRDYLEMKVRTLLTRRKRKRKRSIGWRRWSNEYLYGVLGLYWGWKLEPLPSATAYQ